MVIKLSTLGVQCSMCRMGSGRAYMAGAVALQQGCRSERWCYTNEPQQTTQEVTDDDCTYVATTCLANVMIKACGGVWCTQANEVQLWYAWTAAAEDQPEDDVQKLILRE